MNITNICHPGVSPSLYSISLVEYLFGVGTGVCLEGILLNHVAHVRRRRLDHLKGEAKLPVPAIATIQAMELAFRIRSSEQTPKKRTRR